MKSKGFLLFELLVSIILLLICAGFFISTYINYSTLIRRMDFRQVVVGLLKDTVEFGAADYVGDKCEYFYSYNSAQGKYTSTCVSCVAGITNECADPSQINCCTNPFGPLEDIMSKKITDLHLSDADKRSITIRYKGTVTDRMPDGSFTFNVTQSKDAAGNIVTDHFKYSIINVTGNWTQDGATLSETLFVVPMGLVVSPTISITNATEFFEE